LSYFQRSSRCDDPALALIRRAHSLFRQFHTFAPDALLMGPCQPRPAERVLVHLGRLKGLIYSSDRERCGKPRTFVHFMETPPLLAANPEGTQLHILGGRYRVTRKGIVG
jgi:hypothetical protein